MLEGDTDWDPTVAGMPVRLQRNPGKRGHTTGVTRKVGSTTKVEVIFGSGDKGFRDYEALEPFSEDKGPIEELEAGSFGNVEDIRRLLALEKIRGRLTNVFYSMESSATDFYAHQFKPVLKFLESPVGRLLIADEVGLGKTIEAGFIWKELQARENARRLLVVCPAVLVQKWQDDLARRFAIHADALSASELLSRLQNFLTNGVPSDFVYIVSLEGVRPPRGFEDETTSGTRAELARILDRGVPVDGEPLLDLTIIDEAHYLRNPETLSNLLGNLLRDASAHMLLLTAVPIQIHSDNLYRLLQLVSPEDFENPGVFDEILIANRPVTRALRLLWQNPSDVEGTRTAVEEALTSPYFRDHPVLKGVLNALGPDIDADRALKIDLGRRLENSSLLGRFMTRSRKRDVLPNQIPRSPQVVPVDFEREERLIYDTVTRKIRSRSAGLSGAGLFGLMIRQRQLASCMVAALHGWKDSDLLKELLWEDLGVADGVDYGGFGPSSFSDLNEGSEQPPVSAENLDLAALEANDSKYKKFIDAVREVLATDGNNPPKLVVFAYFRPTLDYLARRLAADGISACIIKGGMGDEKWEVIRSFAEPDGPQILLSSEVGSEGIDLQFCSHLVNYDLPWNPMRVEQRIGRLDRLGQNAERISIINLSLVDTIEQKILDRLYERIRIFQDSIGDLEEILGEMSEQLLTQLLDPRLTDEERLQNADTIADAIENQRAQQATLEQEAINFAAFSDFILDAINDSREKGRWLRPEELSALVTDHMRLHYPGSVFTPHPKIAYAYDIELSSQAKSDLSVFIANANPSTRTELNRSARPVTCLFDARTAGDLTSRQELLGPTHPLVMWLREHYGDASTRIQNTAAVEIDKSTVGLDPGNYGFVVHYWTFEGLRQIRRLAFSAALLGGEPMPEDQAEALIYAAALEGRTWPNPTALLSSDGPFLETVKRCDLALFETFAEKEEAFIAENQNRAWVQEESAQKFSKRKLEELDARIARFEKEGRTRMIPATRGLINAEQRNLDLKLARISDRRNHIDAQPGQLAAGVIRVK